MQWQNANCSRKKKDAVHVSDTVLQVKGGKTVNAASGLTTLAHSNIMYPYRYNILFCFGIFRRNVTKRKKR
jgi:hypothetical protein